MNEDLLKLAEKIEDGDSLIVNFEMINRFNDIAKTYNVSMKNFARLIITLNVFCEEYGNFLK